MLWVHSILSFFHNVFKSVLPKGYYMSRMCSDMIRAISNVNKFSDPTKLKHFEKKNVI